MSELDHAEFQRTVAECLIRHRSVLDVTTKLQEATARVNRAVAKAVTNCGCIQVNASRQCCPEDATFGELREFMQNHLDGELCESCREILETEIGQTMFYLAALCELFDLRMGEIVNKEQGRVAALGPYNLT